MKKCSEGKKKGQMQMGPLKHFVTSEVKRSSPRILISHGNGPFRERVDPAVQRRAKISSPFRLRKETRLRATTQRKAAEWKIRDHKTVRKETMHVT